MTEQLKNEKYCVNCGEKINKKAEICPKCGVRLSFPDSNKRKLGVAVVLSFFFPGLGQIYNGQIGKGILLIFLQIINDSLIIMDIFGTINIPGLLYIEGFIVWIFGMYDAYQTAEKINENY